MTDEPESWSALLIRPPRGRPDASFQPEVIGSSDVVATALKRALPLAEHGPGFVRIGKEQPHVLVLFYKKDGPVDGIGLRAQPGQAAALAVNKVCQELGLGLYQPSTGDFMPIGKAARPIVRVEEVDVGEVRPLRQRLLLAHLPATASLYPADEEEPTFHLGVRRGRHLVAVVSAFWQARQDGPAGAYRIRGLAVTPDARGQGLASALVEEVERRAARAGAAEVWCHAREEAEGFYEAQGYEAVGEPVELEGFGLRRLFVKALAS